MTKLRRIAAASLAAVLFYLGLGLIAGAQESTSSVIAPGYRLPKGFTSIQASEVADTKWRRIDALYTDPTDRTSLRFTTVRGNTEVAEPGRDPIDVCIRDGNTGEVVLAPQVFGAKPMIEGCVKAEPEREQSNDRSAQILHALDALSTVRFKDEYRPEYIALMNQSMRVVGATGTPTPFGGGVLIHRKAPELPAQTVEPPNGAKTRDAK